ncbi:hypothetical protein VCCP103710_1057, partial [Vibrio cholerae CP1037(10)]
MVVIVSKPR